MRSVNELWNSAKGCSALVQHLFRDAFGIISTCVKHVIKKQSLFERCLVT